jgi:mono/diheme cytochrome c family protein
MAERTGQTGAGQLHALLAEFDDVESVTAAARALRDAGYRRFEVYSPFPIHGIERAMGLAPTRLPWIALAAGVTGTSLALYFQWWTNAFDYPFKISGKPLFGIPANIPITFEFTVLLASFGAFFGMLVLNRLPEHHRPVFENERFRRASDDGFFVAVEVADPAFDALSTRALLQAHSRRPVEECRDSGESAAFPRWTRALLASVVALGLLPFAGIVFARTQDSSRPALHVVPDMDSQTRYRAQAANPVFADGRAMRPDVAGAVAFGELAADLVRATGKQDGQFVAHVPADVTPAFVARGRERFGIFCSPCHGAAGYGDGLVALRASELQEQAWVPPASLHDPLVRARPAGQIFDAIVHGVRTMPPYGRQIPPDDAWAIVAYVRALQRSQHGSIDDVPVSERAKLGGPVVQPGDGR